jgi:hypothetical protein
MTTIAQQIIEIVKNHKPKAEGNWAFVYELANKLVLRDNKLEPESTWLLKIGKDIEEYIKNNNTDKLFEGYSLKLSSNIPLAVNHEVFSVSDEVFFPVKDNKRSVVSIIRYVPNQKSPDFAKGQKKIEDFDLYEYIRLVAQMMDAIANGLYPDLIGKNILVNYEEESFQLIDSFETIKEADTYYNLNDSDYYEMLYKKLVNLNNGNDDDNKILNKLNQAIEYMGFTHLEGPYKSDTVIKETIDYYGNKILYFGLKFPFFSPPEEVKREINFSAPFSELKNQLKVLDESIRPYPVCFSKDTKPKER